jgi:hypothetical protein
MARPDESLAAAGLALALVLLAAPARTQGRIFGTEDTPAPLVVAARLDYTRDTGAEACPDESFFADAVGAKVGGVAFTAGGQKRVVVKLRREEPVFVAEAELYTSAGRRSGKRQLKAAACPELVEALSSVVALWLRPVEIPEQPTRIDPSPPVPEPAQPPSPPPPAPAPPARRPRVELGANVFAAFGTAPGPAIGFGGALGLRWSVFALALEGRADLPASTDPKTDGARLRESFYVGTLAPCILQPLAHYVRIVGCALLSAGATRGAALEALPAQRITPYGGAGARLGGEVSLGEHFGLRVSVDVLATLTQTVASVDQRPVWSMAPVTEALALRVFALF